MKHFLLVFFCLFLSITSVSAQKIRSSAVHNIQTDMAAKPEGAYSQGIKVDLSKGKLVFVAGQIAKDPKTGKLFEDDIRIATTKTIENINAILKASGTNLQNVIRMDVFLKDFKDWDEMNAEYAKYFPNGHFPVRQTVQVGMENRIEISCIAFVPQNS